MRKAVNKAIARELALHGTITVLRLQISDLKRRIRVAKRALRRSTKYEPWDDFEWIAAIALDMRRKDWRRK